MTRTFPRVMACLALLLCVPLLSSCLWFDLQLCEDVAETYCEKRFSCTPLAAAGLWGSRSNCASVLRDVCVGADSDPECDFDDSQLRQCRDELEDWNCLQAAPSVCWDIYNCY